MLQVGQLKHRDEKSSTLETTFKNYKQTRSSECLKVELDAKTTFVWLLTSITELKHFLVPPSIWSADLQIGKSS